MNRGKMLHLDSFEKCVIIIALCLFIITRFVGPAYVSGPSMEPTYKDGSFVIMTRYRSGQAIDRGSIVVAREPDRGFLLIKRVVAVPGDRIYAENKQLYVNGSPEEGGFPLFEDPGILSLPLILGEDEYFLMGDNRSHSTDSRIFGPVSADDVVGVVFTGWRKN